MSLRIALLPMLCVLIFVRVRLVGKALCFELGSHFVETGFISCEKMPCQARAKGENRQQKTPDFGGKKGERNLIFKQRSAACENVVFRVKAENAFFQNRHHVLVNHVVDFLVGQVGLNHGAKSKEAVYSHKQIGCRVHVYVVGQLLSVVGQRADIACAE